MNHRIGLVGCGGISSVWVKATGNRRKGGVPKGTKCVATRPAQSGGSRRIRGLPEVCQSEGLPAPKPLSPSERRTVRQSGCEQFAATIATSQIVPRSPAGRSTGCSSLVRSNGHGRN